MEVLIQFNFLPATSAQEVHLSLCTLYITLVWLLASEVDVGCWVCLVQVAHLGGVLKGW
jgi:hypothetical protein